MTKSISFKLSLEDKTTEQSLLSVFVFEEVLVVDEGFCTGALTLGSINEISDHISELTQ
jgi:hypothetical protein